MANITITNVDTGSVVLDLWGVLDGKVLRNAAGTEETFAAGTLLALHATDGKLYPYDPAETSEDLEIPKYVLTYAVTLAATTETPVQVLSAGKVNKNRLVIHDGTAITAAHLDALLNRPIIPVDVGQLALIDNPQS
jgi:hypothetical protein